MEVEPGVAPVELKRSQNGSSAVKPVGAQRQYLSHATSLIHGHGGHGHGGNGHGGNIHVADLPSPIWSIFYK